MVVEHHRAKEFMWIFGKAPQVHLNIVPLQKEIKFNYLQDFPSNDQSTKCQD
jgi:hypothetical protein